MHTTPPDAPQVDLLALGERVRGLRLRRGLTLQAAAQPYSSAYLVALESGYLLPSPRAICALAARLGLSPAELMPPLEVWSGEAPRSLSVRPPRRRPSGQPDGSRPAASAGAIEELPESGGPREYVGVEHGRTRMGLGG